MKKKYAFITNYGIIIGNDIIYMPNLPQEGIIQMGSTLYDTIQMKNYDANMKKLAEMAQPETWSIADKSEYSLLKNYLDKTMDRLLEENKIFENDNFLVFNTGLYDKNYESIYMVAQATKSGNKKWKFNNFCTEYQLDFVDIPTLPERADYFYDPSLLVYDWHYQVRINYKHILEDHPERQPDSIRNSELPLETLKGVIDNSLKRVIANYKLAVPHYFGGTVQLLIPLYFGDKEDPELALTLEKKNGYYQGSTCLTLDMAYNNARLIAKPESNWLTAN